MLTTLAAIRIDGTGTATASAPAIFVPSGTTLTINISVKGQDGAPVNLTGRALLLTIRKRDLHTSTLVLSHQATIDNAAGGLAHFVITDTAGLAGGYDYDVTLIDTNGAPDQVVPTGPFLVTAGLYTPGQRVTVPTAQQPLATLPGSISWVLGRDTWAQILQSIVAMQPQVGVVNVYLDDLGTGGTFTVDVPANLDNVRLISARMPQQVLVDFAAGFQLLGNELHLIGIGGNMHGTMWTYDPAQPSRSLKWELDWSSCAVVPGAPPMAIVGGTNGNQVVLKNASFLQGDNPPGHAAFALLQGASIVAYVLSQSNFDGTMVEIASGASAADFYVYCDATSLDERNVYPITTGITLHLNPSGGAALLPYVPTTPANWTEGAPSDAGTALDKLAARPSGGGGGLSGLTAGRVPFAASPTTLTDDAALAYDATGKALSAPKLAFPDGTTQKRGYCGPTGGLGIVQMSVWALCESRKTVFDSNCTFRGTTWTFGGFQYGGFFEVKNPQDYDSTNLHHVTSRRAAILDPC